MLLASLLFLMPLMLLAPLLLNGVPAVAEIPSAASVPAVAKRPAPDPLGQRLLVPWEQLQGDFLAYHNHFLRAW
jgi:hypothetical protein